jgi:lipopolysaccharide export system permease protein
MKILHKYIASQLLRNLLVSIFLFVFLFSLIDFFDRIDNVLEEDPDLLIVAQYFLYKIPLTISLMLPVAMLVSTLFTIGLLCKNSEFTAMRASGLPVLWLVRPVFVISFIVSVLSIGFNESVVPHSQRRVREIFNIDIKKKHLRGNYSQKDFWWRDGNTFFSARMFDSRDESLIGLAKIKINNDFVVTDHTTAEKVEWLSPSLGWSMRGVNSYRFTIDGTIEPKHSDAFPLPISDTPADFYDAYTDPYTMSYSQLQAFIGKQEANGLSIIGYLSDLYAKISFPFVTFILTLVAVPFALVPARSGSMASSFLAGIAIGFSYYAVHSLSIALGRAEIWQPLMAAWMANVILGCVGLILNAGAESPS